MFLSYWQYKILKKIAELEQGIFVYLPQEAQGRGLREKVRDHRLIYGRNELGEQTNKRTQNQAMELLQPHGYDIRQYYILHKVFSDLGLLDFNYNYLGDSNTKLDQILRQTGLKITTKK